MRVSKVFVNIELNGSIVNAKVCSKCKRALPLENYRFRKYKGSTIPTSACLGCENIERNSLEFKQKQRERGNRYREKNKESIKERTDKWLEDNAERVREKRREYYENNKPELLDRFREYRKENHERISELKNKWYQENRDASIKRSREWAKKNPVNAMVSKLKSRAKGKGQEVNIDVDEVLEMLDNFNYRCALTGDTENLSLDHVVPFYTGRCVTDIKNLIPLRRDLNSSKNNRNIFEWYKFYGSEYGITQESFDKLIEYLAVINDMSRKEYEEYYDSCFSEIGNR